MATLTTEPKVTSIAKTGSTALNGAVTLTGGTNVTLTQSGQDISIASSAGVGGAAGSDTQVQFNDGGTNLGGDAGLTYNKTTDALTVAGNLYFSTNGTAVAMKDSGGIDKGVLFMSGANILTLYNSGSEVRIDNDDSQVILNSDTTTVNGSQLIVQAPIKVNTVESSADGIKSALEINNYASGGGDWFIRAGATGTNTPAGGLSFANGSGYWLSIDSTGRVGIGTNSPTAKLHLSAGTSSASTAPLKLTSGTNLTTAEAGAIEYDGTVFYASPTGSNRHVVDGEQLITLTSTYTLTNNTNVQKLFNSPANGTLTVAASTTYFFECQFSITSLSGSSHTVGFGFGGTATITRQAWEAVALATSTVGTPGTAQISFQTATAAIISSATTTGLVAKITGKLVIGTGGTIIPSCQQNTNSAAAVVGNDSYFRIWPVGSNTVQSVGNWS